MYGLSSASCSTNYTGVNNFSNIQTKNNVAKVSSINNGGSFYPPINGNIFKTISCINSDSTNLLAKNNSSISSSSLSNLSVNDNISINCANNNNSFNLPVKNDVFEVANISSSSTSDIPVNNNVNATSYAGSSNLPEKNTVVKAVGCINSSSSTILSAKNNILEEKSSNIPATKVLDEMYKALRLDIPPVFTFRQETITHKFFCSAGFMNKWYDTEEAYPNQEGAKEVAAQSLLKIIMASEEYEKYLQVENQNTNHQTNVRGSSRFLKNIQLKQTTPGKNLKKRKKKNKGKKPFLQFKKQGGKQSFTRKANKQIKKLQIKKLNAAKAVVEQNTLQNTFCPLPVSKQESKPKKVKFDDRIFILGEDIIPKSKSNSSKGIMSQKNQISYNQIHNEPETYQALVSEFSEKDKIRISASRLLDEFCIFSNISKPKYNFCNDGYGNHVAEILVSNIKYVSERDRVFWCQNEAQEYVAERAFNILYAESDVNTRTKFKKRISLTFLDRLPDISNKVAASQQRHESQIYAPAFPNYDNQPFTHIPSQLPEAYCNVASQPMVNISTMSTTSSADPFSTPSVPNFGSVQTHWETSTQIPTGHTSSADSSTVSQQSMTSQFPYTLHKLVNERDWGFVEYQYSKTLQGYKCTCHVKKLKFTSNTCVNKESARNQAAKIALLALSEYGDCEI